MDRAALEDPTTVHLVRPDDERTAKPLPAERGFERHSQTAPTGSSRPTLSHLAPIPDRAHQRTIDWAPAKAPIDLERAQ